MRKDFSYLLYGLYSSNFFILLGTLLCNQIPMLITLFIGICTGLFKSPWNMSENWQMPQLNEDSNDYIFQQDGSPAHH